MRVSLFVSGCTHRCKGCFNEEAQAFDYGEPFTKAVEDSILESLSPEYITGLTILGGEPMEPDNQRALVPFLRRFRERFGNSKTLWVYTGCVWERLKGGGEGDGSQEAGNTMEVENSTVSPVACPLPPNAYKWRTEVTDEFLSMVDVLVDGPFVEELKDISLRFRGSSNQRILELKKEQVSK